MRRPQSTRPRGEIIKERAHLTEILHIPVEESGPNGDEGVPIFAPASGTVLQRKATTGSVVNAGDFLVVKGSFLMKSKLLTLYILSILFPWFNPKIAEAA